MDASFRVAQSGVASTPQRIVPVTKPASGQALKLQLDPGSKLDLSAVAGEKMALVHAGASLVIVFDNKASVTVEPFFGPDGKPLADLNVDLGNQTVSGAQFAALFPITEDQSIIPAA